MKIRAIRLREVGCFSDPVEVNGFSGGLDVLSGPNEHGKSTLLKALRSLFTYGHMTKSQEVEALRPYAGGAPLIEVDFEVNGGGIWRFRKQFLSERQALLTDLRSGTVAARGEDAHKQALELIGGDQQLGLLWVKQGGSLQQTVPSDAARERLSQVIEREIQSAAGGQETRIVRAQAEQQRRLLVTPRASKPTGDYQKAIAERDGIAQALDMARSAVRQSAERAERMQALKARYAELNNPSAVADRRDAIDVLTRAREDAVVARQRLRLVDTEVKALESSSSEARQAHQIFARQMTQVQELEAAIAASFDAEGDVGRSLDELTQESTEIRAKRDGLRADLEAELVRLKQREAGDRRREAAQCLESLNALLSQVRSAVERAKAIEAGLSTEPVTERLFKAAENEASAVSALEARIAAQLPKVRIAYNAGASGRIKVDGRPLLDGETLTPGSPTAFEIDGVGIITVDPAISADTDYDQADLEAHRAELAAKLAIAGVDDLEALRHRFETRRALERELQQLTDGIAARAPMGPEALAAEVARLAEVVSATPEQTVEDLPGRNDIEGTIARLTAEHRRAEQETESVGLQHASAGKKLAGIIAQKQSCEKQLAVLAAALPPAARRTERLKALEAQLSSAAEGLAAALRTRGAWAEKALNEEQMRDLDQRLAEAMHADRAAQAEAETIRLDLAVIGRDLERDCEDGIETKVSELEQKLSLCQARVVQFDRDLAALNVLLGVLDQVEAQSRARYLSPVMKRFETYAGLVFPGAAITMKGDLSIEGVERGGGQERLSALSDGTQEQIAVLARLAFGQLLADAGQPSPLILDDALVYSDDIRLEAVFGALQSASAAHQVIVLTCRARAFERLGGTQLTLDPWTPG